MATNTNPTLLRCVDTGESQGFDPKQAKALLAYPNTRWEAVADSPAEVAEPEPLTTYEPVADGDGESTHL